MRFRLLLTAVLIALASCTTFNDEALDILELSKENMWVGYAGHNEVITVRSGSKWDISAKPTWVGVTSIKSTDDPFKWDVELYFYSNTGEERQASIFFTNLTATKALVVTQTGGYVPPDVPDTPPEVVHVTSIKLSEASIELYEGESRKLVPTILPEDAANKSVKWASSNEIVASVDSDGNVKARSLGTAIITVTANDGGAQAKCKVTVLRHVASISFDCEDSFSIVEGESTTITASVNPQDASNRRVTWKTSQPDVASISVSGYGNWVGTVKANAVGTTVITATSTDGSQVSKSCTITVVKKQVEVKGVTVSNPPEYIYVGDNDVKLSASVTPDDATDKTVTWKSSDTDVLAVGSRTGKLTPKKKGTATITATASNGVSGSCDIEVRVHASSVSVSPSQLELYEGEPMTLTATVLPDDAYDKSVTWSSSDSKIVSVGKYDGKVTAVKQGTATITATTTDSERKGTCTITVIKADVVVSDLTVSASGLTSMGLGDKRLVTVTIQPSSASDKTLEWEIADPQVATLEQVNNNSAYVIAHDCGTTTLTITPRSNTSKKKTVSIEVKFDKPGYVDLGLPSGVRWGKWNVGAAAIRGYGGYYAWAETAIKDSFSWSYYIWCGGTDSSLTKYKTPGSRIEADDDVATKRFGGQWRIPTKDEWIELMENCTLEWTKQDGVEGMLVKSKKYTSRTIFLPAAGCYSGSVMSDEAGVTGVYWSATLRSTDARFGCYLTFKSTGAAVTDDYMRFRGLSIRPVYGSR